MKKLFKVVSVCEVIQLINADSKEHIVAMFDNTLKDGWRISSIEELPLEEEKIEELILIIKEPMTEEDFIGLFKKGYSVEKIAGLLHISTSKVINRYHKLPFYVRKEIIEFRAKSKRRENI